MAYTIPKDELANLRKLYSQVNHSYRACMDAIANGDHKHAVTLQLDSIEALNTFNDQVLRDLELMRTGPKDRTWAP